jgi:Transposase domain (DUF772)
VPAVRWRICPPSCTLHNRSHEHRPLHLTHHASHIRRGLSRAWSVAERAVAVAGDVAVWLGLLQPIIAWKLASKINVALRAVIETIENSKTERGKEERERSFVGYCYGIRFERRLCEEVELHLAYRWFCRLDLDDSHSGATPSRCPLAAPFSLRLSASARAWLTICVAVGRSASVDASAARRRTAAVASSVLPAGERCSRGCEPTPATQPNSSYRDGQG